MKVYFGKKCCFPISLGPKVSVFGRSVCFVGVQKMPLLSLGGPGSLGGIGCLKQDLHQGFPITEAGFCIWVVQPPKYGVRPLKHEACSSF